MSENKIVIGSRGSELALWQTNFVASALQKTFPDLVLEVKIIKTTGDKLLDVSLAKIGDKGLFTKQIEAALLAGEIDIAVHSLKDLQTEQPQGLEIGAVLEREVPNDVFVSTKYSSIEELPKSATVATGSLRRRSQLLHYRPDLKITEIRGNVPTRLEKLAAADIDGTILAYAGVERLGLSDHIKQVIPFSVMLPAVGQGAVAVEIRSGDPEVSRYVSALNHPETQICVAAERAFLKTIEGGCQIPAGANADLSGSSLTLEGFVGNLDGSINLRSQVDGTAAEAENMGARLAESLIERGARDLIRQARETVETASAAPVL